MKADDSRQHIESLIANLQADLMALQAEDSIGEEELKTFVECRPFRYLEGRILALREKTKNDQLSQCVGDMPELADVHLYHEHQAEVRGFIRGLSMVSALLGDLADMIQDRKRESNKTQKEHQDTRDGGVGGVLHDVFGLSIEEMSSLQDSQL